MFVDKDGKIIFDLIKEEQRLKYGFLIYCDNLLASILEISSKEQWCNVELNIKEKDKNKWESDKYNIGYFRTHGYSKEINTMYYRKILFCLLADYLEYVSNSIECASRKQMGACYSLLRKPLKDNLLFIEFLALQRHWFVGRFFNKDISEYRVEGISEKTKKRLIREVCKKVGMPKFNKMLYNFRYNKKILYSLEYIWNPASHIITTFKNFKTANGNFNMIFNDEENDTKLMNHFFEVIPAIYNYTLRVFMYILKEEKLINDTEYAINSAITNIKNTVAINEKFKDNENVNEFLFTCPHCFKSTYLKENTQLKNDILYNSSTICTNCKHAIRLDKFLEYKVGEDNEENI